MGRIPDVDEVLRCYKELEDPVYKQNIVKLIPSSWEMLGVPTKVKREMMKEYKGVVESAEDFEKVIDFIDEAFERKIIDLVVFGLSLIDMHKKFLKPEFLDNVKGWAPQVEDWALCDTFTYITLSYMINKGIIVPEDIYFLKNHKHLFARRMFIVSLLFCFRKGHQDFDKLLDELIPFIEEREKYIYMAISWVLREGTKSNPARIKAFLEKHRASLHSSVVREVENKLTTGKKNP